MCVDVNRLHPEHKQEQQDARSRRPCLQSIFRRGSRSVLPCGYNAGLYNELCFQQVFCGWVRVMHQNFGDSPFNETVCECAESSVESDSAEAAVFALFTMGYNHFTGECVKL
jgi:hypothetical protein